MAKWPSQQILNAHTLSLLLFFRLKTFFERTLKDVCSAGGGAMMFFLWVFLKIFFLN